MHRLQAVQAAISSCWTAQNLRSRSQSQPPHTCVHSRQPTCQKQDSLASTGLLPGRVNAKGAFRNLLPGRVNAMRTFRDMLPGTENAKGSGRLAKYRGGRFTLTCCYSLDVYQISQSLVLHGSLPSLIDTDTIIWREWWPLPLLLSKFTGLNHVVPSSLACSFPRHMEPLAGLWPVTLAQYLQRPQVRTNLSDSRLHSRSCPFRTRVPNSKLVRLLPPPSSPWSSLLSNQKMEYGISEGQRRSCWHLESLIMLY